MLFKLVRKHSGALRHSFEDPVGDTPGLPKFVESEFQKFERCGRPEFGFIRLKCERCQTEHALPFACKTRVLCPSCGARRMHDLTQHIMENVLPEAPVRQWVISPPFELAALLAVRPKVLSHMVRLFVKAVSSQMRFAAGQGDSHCGAIVMLQRFTKSMSLFPHAHVIFVDGVYVEQADGEVEFVEIPPPSERDLLEVARSVFQKMERYLKRHGYMEEEGGELSELERWWLRATKEPSLLRPGPPQAKRRAHGVNFGGFSIHAGVRIKAKNRKGREQLVRYAARPSFCEEQLKLLDDGRVELQLRSPTKAGQTHVHFHPVQFLRRLAWLIPPPYFNMTRYCGVFGATHKLRKKIVPRKAALHVVTGSDATTPYRISWARLLAKVYDIDAEVCPGCGGKLSKVAGVTDFEEAAKYLAGGMPVLGPRATGPPKAA